MSNFTMTPVGWAGTLFSSKSYIQAVKWTASDPNPKTSGAEPFEPVTASLPGQRGQYVRSQPKNATELLTVILVPGYTEANVLDLYALFDPNAGEQYIQHDDGDAKRWRRAASLQASPLWAGQRLFKVPMHFTDARWEEDSAPAAVTSLNQTGTPFTQNITPVGNRDTDDVQITITPDSVKTKGFSDWKFQFGGFFANRAPNDLKDKMVYLGDQSAGAARFATNSSAAGATVLQTTGSTSITADITAGATSISLTDASAWPSSGMGYLTDSRGNGFHDQFRYSSKAANTLLGVVWLPATANGREPGGTVITAGGIAHTQAQETAIQPSGIMLSADDLAVWLDGRRYDDAKVYPVNWNAASSDVVAVVDMPKRKAKTVAAAMTAASPANGGEIQFLESVSDLKRQGIMAIGNELIGYTDVDVANKKVTNVRRALHGSTAAIHAVGDTAEFSLFTFVVAVGKATAPVTARPVASRPAPQLIGSSNLVRKYGDGTDDANSVYYDPSNPNRPESWDGGFDADGNDVSPIMSASVTTTALTFKDDVPGDGKPARNFYKLSVPFGIKSGDANAVLNDWTPSAEILNLELFLEDARRELKLIDQLQQSAAAAGRALPAALADVAYAIKLKGRYNILTGFRGSDGDNTIVISNATNDALASGTAAVQFTIDQTSKVPGFQFRLEKVTAGTQLISILLCEDSGGLPGTAIQNFGDVLSVTNSIATHKLALPTYTIGKPGTYWLILFMSSGFAPVRWKSAGGGGSQFVKTVTRVGAAWIDAGGRDAWFNILSDYDNEGKANIQRDQPLRVPGTDARTGTTAAFDKTVITLSPTQSIYGHRFGSFASTYMHYATEIERTTPSGDSVELDTWGVLASNVVVDCKAHTCTYTENGYSRKFGPKLGSSGEWPSLIAGANVLTFTEPDISQVDVSTAYRSKKI